MSRWSLLLTSLSTDHCRLKRSRISEIRRYHVDQQPCTPSPKPGKSTRHSQSSYALALSVSGKPSPAAESSSILANFFGTIRCYARGKYKAFRPSLGTTQTRGCWFGTDCLRCRKTRKRRSGCRPLDGTANVFLGSHKRRYHMHSSSCHSARMGRKGVGVPLETSSSRWMSDSRFFRQSYLVELLT